jgi:transcriptional regulator with XRE-family HTH domain
MITLVSVAGHLGDFTPHEGLTIMVRPSPDPTSSIYAFMAYHLRFLRKKKNLTQTQVGDIIGCTKGQVSKLELGSRQLDERDCRALDATWDTGGLFMTLLGYAKLGVDPNWREKLRRYQTDAVVHRIFQNNLISMPFQTEEYARALLEVGHAAGKVEDVDRAVSRRMDHQAAMLDGRPQIWAVLDESALRPMGGAEVMEPQRDRLLELSRLHHVSIRVLPHSATPHLGVDGSFMCFELRNGHRAGFAGTYLDVGRVIDDRIEAADAAVRFERIAAQAWSENQTREWLAREWPGGPKT